jgi:hypothetical protein
MSACEVTIPALRVDFPVRPAEGYASGVALSTLAILLEDVELAVGRDTPRDDGIESYVAVGVGLE